jgi:hypothetical protein
MKKWISFIALFFGLASVTFAQRVLLRRFGVYS